MELGERIVELIDHIGGAVTDREIAYQLRKRGLEVSDAEVVAECFELAEAGRLDPETRFRVVPDRVA